jgi:lipoprotein-anchoring transpeptidase ErfK/SrfK
MAAILALVVIAAQFGCVTEPPTKTTNTSPAANTNAANAPPTPAAPMPTTAPPKSANDQQMTLPLLDAFFAQDAFASELKSKLLLTDEQVNKLKGIARRETAKLRESDNDQRSAGTAKAARVEASEQIKAVVGEQKLQELTAFLNDRWNGNTDASTTGGVGAPQDTRVVVNAPAFRMDLFEDGKLIKSYKIGIGYPEFPLPTGLRKAETIIFNPTWTPPDEPWVESPNSKVRIGEKIEAGDKLNPLGPIKVPIGLPSLIHGGKAPAKLGGFASHGCVGLTSPQVQDFAKRVARLSGTQISDEQIAEYGKNKTETKPLKLSKAVPVELRYETITVEDGKLHIYRDVYDHGTNTEDNLRNVLQAYGVAADQLTENERAQVMRGLSQMARDATGKPSEADGSTPKKNPTGKVTRTIKGTKEVIIEIAALAGKGYPAPVDLDTGIAPKKTAPRRHKK